MQTQPLLVLLFFFAVGIWLRSGMALPMVSGGVLLVATVLVSGWYVRQQRPRAAWGFLCVALCIFGMLRAGQAATLAGDDISRFSGRQGTITAIVDEVPQSKPATEGQVTVKYVLAVQQAVWDQADNVVQPVSGRMLVTIRQTADAPRAAYQDCVQLRGTVSTLQGYNNPGVYDSVAAQRRQQITARLSGSPALQLLQPAQGFSWQAAAGQWRTQLAQHMDAVMPPADSAMLQAVLFGGYAGIKKEVLQDFAATGIIHILSVSGTHMALVGGILLWLGQRAGLRREQSAALAAAAVVSYALFSGLTPPVLRSAIMAIIALAAIYAGRIHDAVTALSLAALGMLLYQPDYVYDVSFLLSFGCTAGLFFLYPKTAEGLTHWLPLRLAQTAALTIAVQLAVLPITAWYFNAVSLSAMVANLLIIPIVETVVVVGLTACLLSFWLLPVANILFVGCSLLLGLSAWLADILAAVPFATVYVPYLNVPVSAVYYMLVSWLYGYATFLPTPLVVWRQRPVVAAGLLCGSALLVCVWLLYPQPVRLHVLDVGQGDAILLTTPHRHAVLIDSGGTLGSQQGFDVGERVVLPYLKHYGVRELDYLLLTHGHEDHAGGAAALAAALPIHNVVTLRTPYAQPVENALRYLPSSAWLPPSPGQVIELDGVEITTVYAPVPTADAAGLSNEDCCVFRIRYGEHSFLLTGDLEEKGEQRLLTENTYIQSTVLKVGHHGAKTSTSQDFLDQVRPLYAVISVGADNRFGHPHTTVLQRLAARNIPVYRTDRQGAICFSTDGQRLEIATYVLPERQE